MKKVISLFVAIFIIALVFISCNKKEDAVQPAKVYVNGIQGSFIAEEGDITLKSADLNKVTRTWTMYAKNSPHYANAPFALVRGSEFITNSAGYNFWSIPANNPVSFNVSQDGQVYSNLTPDENLRNILETKNAAGNTVYLGINDFRPSVTPFPLHVHAFRLGDQLTLNTKALFDLPGSDRISVSVKFTLASIDLDATKLGVITNNEFCWNNVVYRAPVDVNMPAVAGDNELYSGLTDKVVGKIIITVTDLGSTLTPPTGSYSATIEIPNQPGVGHALKISTTKLGWYDSNFATFTDSDITVTPIDVPMN